MTQSIAAQSVAGDNRSGRAAIDQIARASRAAFAESVLSAAAQRSGWLRAIADALEAAADELVDLADEESHLGRPRLSGELARTTAQLRLFADAIIEGSYLEVIIDHGDATAAAKPDLRRMLRPLGPVAVFSASNFPFAFSVAGGDTASALAAGCPVIVKGHSAHPALSLRTAEIVTQALADVGAPHGIFALVQGREAGVALVQHPEVRAVGFTGSLEGGRALFALAAARPDPIPFYGELGATNPVFITPGALLARAEELADGLAASFTMGVGQFCTNPGAVLVPVGCGFSERVSARVGARAPERMLSLGIADAFAERVASLKARPGVTIAAGGGAPERGSAAPVVLSATCEAALADPDTMLAECFGPSTLILEYRTQQEALETIRAMGGSLTATIHAEADDDLGDVLPALTELAGRVLFNGWPTGVAVNWAQQHGGPWPASSTIHTSVGVTAIRRFLRPIAYQDAPESALPAELRESNPLGIPRRVDGRMQTA